MNDENMPSGRPARGYRFNWTAVEVGAGLALVGQGLIAVFDPLSAALAARLWALVEEGATADDLLEEVSVGGLKSLGSFALAHSPAEDGVLHVVVRQVGTVELSSEGRVEHVTAGAVRTWVERTFDEEVQSVRLSLPGASTRFESPFRINSGVVPAVALQWGNLPAVDLVGVSTGLPEVDTESVLVARSSSEMPLGTGMTGEPAGEDASTVTETDLGSQASSSENPVVDEHALPAEDLGATLIERPSPVVERGPLPPPTPPDDDRPSSAWDDIFGATVARSVQSAAVFSTDEDDSLISDVPSDDSSRADPPAAPPDPSFGDHDGRTITKAQLDAMRSRGDADRATAGPMGGVSVQAVVCGAGHPSPPNSQFCRQCGQPVSGAVVTVARPPLGVLRIGSDVTLTLDRPLLIGRNPKVTGMVAGELPAVYQIEDASGISRTHLAIRLEGWQVLVEDLNSANGTTVTLPGRQPHRLHPGEPALLVHGAMIDLGGELTAEYSAR